MLYQIQNPHGGDIYGEEVLLDFSANTNPFGTPQGVIQALQTALPNLHRYPDPYCRKLIGAISAHEQVPAEYILCGSGAAELIYSYCEAVHPHTAAMPVPTFSEYALGLKRAGCSIRPFVLGQENDFTLGESFLTYLSEITPDVVFLCNPNNPTGKTIPFSLLKEILSLCSKGGIRLFVDECFLDLSDTGESLKPFLADHPQLFILKAFTKSYGLAGVRLGYCLSSDTELLKRMSAAVQPWNVSALAQVAGVAALLEKSFLRKTKAMIPQERRYLTEMLRSFGFWVCPSETNFLLFRGPEELRQHLKEKKILIRDCSNFDGLCPGWFRIAVRLHEENEALVHGIQEVLPWQKTL